MRGSSETKRHTVDNVPNCFKSGASYGPLVYVQFDSLPVEPKEEDIAPDIKDRIDASRQKRQGDGGYGSINWVARDQMRMLTRMKARLTLEDAQR